MEDKYKVCMGITGTISITSIILYALYLGEDGVLLAGGLAAVSAIVAGTVGYVTGAKKV